MKKTFTQIRSIACYLLFIFSIKLAAQPLSFSISAPNSIAGRYEIVKAGFGPQVNTEILNKPIKQGNVPDSLACNALPLTIDLTGNIAFVDRGTCAFVEKAKNAQLKGAIAVIICNSATGVFGSPGGADPTINVQTFMMKKEDCDKIKVELRKGVVNGSLAFPPCAPVADTTIKNAIWGKNPGEGDFAEGIGKWTIETAPGKGWEWQRWGVTKGAYSGNTFINSNTACNGVMLFDSDFLDNKGSTLEADEGTGTCPATCQSSFTSPNIDLSGVSNLKGLSVQFTQAYRQNGSRFFLLYSLNNGTTWDSIRLNAGAVVNADATTALKTKVGICVPNIATTKQLKIRFAMDGSYYFWAIDDVFIINEDASDLGVSTFIGLPYAFKTPVSQASTFPLVADIQNFGAAPAPNTVVTATITTAAAVEVQKETNNFNTVQPCEERFDIPFPNRGKNPSTVGNYIIKYSVSTSGKTENTANDARQASFRMTNNSFSNCLSEAENGQTYLTPINRIYANPTAFFGTSNMSVGYYYFFPKGSGYKASRFNFGINDINSQTGDFQSLLTCKVFKIKKGGKNEELTPDEMTLVAEGFDPTSPLDREIFVDSNTVNRRMMHFILKDMSGKDFKMEDNVGYAFIINTSFIKGPPAGTGQIHIFPFLGYTRSTRSDFNTFGYEYTNNETLKQEWVYGSIIKRGDILATNQDLNIYNEVIIEPLTNIEEPLAETSFNIYPNPASTELFVDLDLVNTAKTVNIEITDVTGRVLASETRTNVKSETVTIPVSRIPSGVYLTKISTPEGSATKKVIIAN
jgi:hypothetical protein